MSAASSQNHDSGKARRRPARRPLLTNGATTVAMPPRRVKGVGRHAARHYDPITGRRRKGNAS